MKLFVFGSSLTSAYWNGAATYYRGIYRSLHALGYEITFAEPDIYGRQQNRDCGEIDYAEVIVYQTPGDLGQMLAQSKHADLVIKHSGVGADDGVLEREILRAGSGRLTAFWDVDAPATLARVENNPADPFRPLIPQYDYIFTYGGGPPVMEHYRRLGARNCYPIYNGLDPDTHYPVAADPELVSDLLFVGHRLPDRERRVEEFFMAAAEAAPQFAFLLGGEGWGDRPSLPPNVRWIGHVGTARHNVLNCSARMVLNINRDSMASTGFSPPTRVFEAAGAGACLITDAWAGIDCFFQPGQEILLARSASDIVGLLNSISPQEASRIGRAMRRRALREHTYQLRAEQVDGILQSRTGQVPHATGQSVPVKSYV